MAVGDEQAPRPVGAQVVGHAAGAVHGQAVRGQHLLAQEHQPRVVADVPVRQEDPVRRRAAGQGVELGRHVGGRVEQVGAPARPVDEPEARHLLRRPPAGADVGAEVAVAPQVRDAAVLGDAEHRQRPARVGVLHRPRRDRRRDQERGRQSQESQTQNRRRARIQPHDASVTHGAVADQDAPAQPRRRACRVGPFRARRRRPRPARPASTGSARRSRIQAGRFATDERLDHLLHALKVPAEGLQSGGRDRAGVRRPIRAGRGHQRRLRRGGGRPHRILQACRAAVSGTGGDRRRVARDERGVADGPQRSA